MFLSRDSKELHGSNAIAGPDGRLWSEVTRLGRRPWFLAAFAGSGPAAPVRWTCLSWDADVIERVQADGAEALVKLICVGAVAPRESGLAMRVIREIHRGSAGGATAYVFIDDEGHEFCADLEGTKAAQVRGRHFVARIDSCVG